MALWAFALFAIFRALSYAHGLGGMALVGAVPLSLLMALVAFGVVHLAIRILNRIFLMDKPRSLAKTESSSAIPTEAEAQLSAKPS